jgi:hypothetical protein
MHRKMKPGEKIFVAYLDRVDEYEVINSFSTGVIRAFMPAAPGDDFHATFEANRLGKDSDYSVDKAWALARRVALIEAHLYKTKNIVAAIEFNLANAGIDYANHMEKVK